MSSIPQWYEMELDDDISELGGSDEHSFRVETVEQLNWVFRKIGKLQKQAADVKEAAEKETFRIHKWMERELEKINRSNDYLETLLRDYAERQRDIDPTWKKQTTPYGLIRFEKQKDETVYDDVKLLKWLEDNEYYDQIKVVKSIANKSNLKKLFNVSNGHWVEERTGAIVSGVTVYERPEKLTIKVEG